MFERFRRLAAARTVAASRDDPRKAAALDRPSSGNAAAARATGSDSLFSGSR